jgi:hypothetical protein
MINIKQISSAVVIFAQGHEADLIGLWHAEDCIEFFLFKNHQNNFLHCLIFIKNPRCVSTYIGHLHMVQYQKH